MGPIQDAATRWLVELWGTPEQKLELLYGQTEADRAAIAQWNADCEAVAHGALVAKRIQETPTRDETPLPPTARVLFPIWEAQEPLADAVRVALARAHLEAA